MKLIAAMCIIGTLIASQYEAKGPMHADYRGDTSKLTADDIASLYGRPGFEDSYAVQTPTECLQQPACRHMIERLSQLPGLK